MGYLCLKKYAAPVGIARNIAMSPQYGRPRAPLPGAFPRSICGTYKNVGQPMIYSTGSSYHKERVLYTRGVTESRSDAIVRALVLPSPTPSFAGSVTGRTAQCVHR